MKALTIRLYDGQPTGTQILFEYDHVTVDRSPVRTLFQFYDEPPPAGYPFSNEQPYVHDQEICIPANMAYSVEYHGENPLEEPATETMEQTMNRPYRVEKRT